LFGFENFIWPFGLISSSLALKSSVGPLALFWTFYAEKVSFEGNYYYFIFFRDTQLQIFVTNAMVDRRPLSDVSKM